MFFLIGHRGVGKTSLLKGIDESIDLDEFISKDYDISKVFSEQGEEQFRKIEKRALDKVLGEKKCQIVSLGAGFDLKNYFFPKDSKFIWIQRSSDQIGRIFLDRPRLNMELNPLEEFIKRKKERDPVFREFSDFCLALEEGDFSNKESIKTLKDLMRNNLTCPKRGYFKPSSNFELEVFRGNVELRTDVFDSGQILELIKKSSSQYKTILVSVRNKSEMDLNFLKFVVDQGALIDIPLEYDGAEELIKNFSKEQALFSLHEKRSLDQIKEIISKNMYHLKWAPEVESFEELCNLDSLSVDRVSFLPRSRKSEESYAWYRLLRSNKIEFYRYGITEYLDQPLYLESFDFQRENIGAVVGENTFLSWSPAFHRDFFRKCYDSSYLNISCLREEFNKNFIRFMKSKGVRYLSVTSPFKNKAGDLVNLTSCNTLDLKKNQGVNTDQNSINHWVDEIKSRTFKKVLIWGSGVMGRAFKEKLKNIAIMMSSRSETSKLELPIFEALVWAAGPQADLPFFILNQQKSLKAIYDLDYKEGSKGRFLALKTGALYISGEKFFEIQAKGQRVFFKGEE